MFVSFRVLSLANFFMRHTHTCVNAHYIHIYTYTLLYTHYFPLHVFVFIRVHRTVRVDLHTAICSLIIVLLSGYCCADSCVCACVLWDIYLFLCHLCRCRTIACLTVNRNLTCNLYFIIYLCAPDLSSAPKSPLRSILVTLFFTNLFLFF